MGLFFYNIFLFLYGIGIRLAAIFNSKAKQWVTGRRDIWEKLITQLGDQQSETIWVHCASLGEFEQGRPIIERIKVDYPKYKLVLTFFSPSGYEIRKNYEKADWVFYLPMDSAQNAKKFFEIVRPSLVIFVKYEFWYYYLKQINQKKSRYCLSLPCSVKTPYSLNGMAAYNEKCYHSLIICLCKMSCPGKCWLR